MAGYVAIKFKKKYKQHSSNPTPVKEAEDTCCCSKQDDSRQSATRLWSESIDWGGPYRINNELMPHCSPFHTGATHPYNQSFYFIHSSRFIF